MCSALPLKMAWRCASLRFAPRILPDSTFHRLIGGEQHPLDTQLANTHVDRIVFQHATAGIQIHGRTVSQPLNRPLPIATSVDSPRINISSGKRLANMQKSMSQRSWVVPPLFWHRSNAPSGRAAECQARCTSRRLDKRWGPSTCTGYKV